MGKARTVFNFALLFTAAAAVYLIGNSSVPLWDRDEPRYAQCARQMLESHDWVVPRLYDEIRVAKPPFIYWCQASAMQIVSEIGLGHLMSYPQVFAARLPSAAATLLILVLLSGIIWKFLGPERAFWTAFIFGTSLLTIYSAKVAMTDAVLLLWTTIAQLCLYAIWRHAGTWSAIVLLAVALALGGLTKGPLILGFLACTAGMLWVFGASDKRAIRRGQPSLAPAAAPKVRLPWVKSLVGLALFAAIVLPWIVLVNLREPTFLPQSFGNLFAHVKHGTEGHWAPPGYHLLLIWITFFPWCLLLPFAIVSAWKHRDEPPVRFALAAAIGPWLLLEVIVQTKLPHYMLATFPALAYLTADAVVRSLNQSGKELKSSSMVKASAIIAIAIVVVGLLPWLAVGRFNPLPCAKMVVVTVISIGAAATIFGSFRRQHASFALGMMGVSMLLLAFNWFGNYLPHAEFLQLAPRAAAVLIREGAVKPGDAYMLDYKEPSLAFYQGGTIRESPKMKELVTRGHISEWTPWMVITRDVWDATPPAVRSHLQIVKSFKGLAISDGMRVEELMVVRKSPAPAE